MSQQMILAPQSLKEEYDALKAENEKLKEEKKENEEGLYKCDDHLTLLQRWIDENDWQYPNKEFIDRVCGEEDNLKKWYYELYDIIDYSEEDVDCYFTCKRESGEWVRLKDGRECRCND
jgi:predicted nuclease with TOPRIM domain